MKLKLLDQTFTGPHQNAETIGDIPGLYAVYPCEKYGENNLIDAGKSHCLQTKLKQFEKNETWQPEYEIFVCYVVKREKRHQFVKDYQERFKAIRSK